MHKNHFFSLWVGKQPSIYEILCYLSFVRNDQSFTLYTYEKFQLPDEIDQVTAENIVPRSEFENFKGGYAEFSDYFRFKALSILNPRAIWVDGDILCLGQAFPKDAFLYGLETKNIVGSAIVSFPSDSLILEEVNNLLPSQVGLEWGKTGPILLTSVLRKHDMFNSAKRQHVFYPIPGRRINLFLDPEKRDAAVSLITDSSTIHLWSQMFAVFQVPKDRLPPEGSLLASMFQIFFPEVTGQRLDDAWLRKWTKYYKKKQFLSFLNNLLLKMRIDLNRSTIVVKLRAKLEEAMYH